MKTANVCAALIAIAASAAVIAAPTATAASCNPDHLTLSVWRSRPNHIDGSGGAWNCSSTYNAVFELQRHRYYGWETMARRRERTFNPNTSYSLEYYCRNTGTHTYRTRMYGTNLGGRGWHRESAHMRSSC
jgi:hypothetical protein